MKFRDASEDFQTGEAMLEIIDQQTTARDFYKRLTGLFVSRLYVADKFFCDECWSPILPYGNPRAEVLCSPMRLRVTMTVTCNCVGNDYRIGEAEREDEIPW